MLEIFVKRDGNRLVPVSAEDEVLLAQLEQSKTYKVKVVKARNYQFFRKWWALVKFGFEHWEPVESPNRWGIQATKNLDAFRKDIIILTGRYDAFFRLNGETRIEAKSISFSSMSEEDFSALYSETIDVILKRICGQYSGEELERLSMEALNYV